MRRRRWWHWVLFGAPVFVLALVGIALLRPIEALTPKKQSDPTAPYSALQQLSVELTRHPWAQNFIIYMLPKDAKQHGLSQDDATIIYSRYTEKLTWIEHNRYGQTSSNTWEYIEDADIPLVIHTPYNAQHSMVPIMNALDRIGDREKVAWEEYIKE